MATNEIYKYGQWISMPLPNKGSDPKQNLDGTNNGDPVLIGHLVGVAQEVGGVPTSVSVGHVSWAFSRNTADSLEPGYASIATVGAFAFSQSQWVSTGSGDYPTPPVNPLDVSTVGMPVYIVPGTSGTPGSGTSPGVRGLPAKLTIASGGSSGNHLFGILIGWTKDPAKRPIVKIVQNFQGAEGTLPGPLLPPNPPTAAAGTQTGPGSVSVSWTAPSGGTAPTSYKVSRSSSASGPWTGIGTATVSPYQVNGLANGNYYFQVISSNANGDSTGDVTSQVTVS
jgi:hypothetical protein